MHSIMAENSINELLKGKRFWRITPPKEKLLEKMIGLEEEITRYKTGISLDDRQKHILETCEDYIRIVKELIKAKWSSSHPHLAWNLLHRVDERIILLMPEDELSARVIDVKTTFDLTIKEEPVRKEWLGEKGKLVEAVADITSGGKNIDKSRCMVREALQYLNNFVDNGFWTLSMNTLMSVWSASLLAVFTLIYFKVYHQQSCVPDVTAFAILGLMGAYLSNLLTKEDFLFVRGGPYFRYLLYNLTARPVIGAFSAVFFYLVEQSKLIFSINRIDEGKTIPIQPTVTNINVNEDVARYVYIVFAIAVGFAGEKILRRMMDKVLKRLEEKAEKTKETSSKAKKDEEKKSDC